MNDQHCYTLYTFKKNSIEVDILRIFVTRIVIETVHHVIINVAQYGTGTNQLYIIYICTFRYVIDMYVLLWL